MQLDRFGACNENCAEVHHCQAYVGRNFKTSTVRLLIISLDQGRPATPEAPCLTLQRRSIQISSYRDDMAASPDERRFNGHYRGCVLTADALYGMGCSPEDNEQNCYEMCRRRNENSCALLQFVQTNAVKSVPRTNRTMEWSQVFSVKHFFRWRQLFFPLPHVDCYRREPNVSGLKLSY